MEVKLRDTDIFKQLIGLMTEVLSDESIPQDVRFKYFIRLEGIKEALYAHKDSESDKQE